MIAVNEPRWKVGDLARRTGLTVRTLHHFDEIGLLRPAERSAAGHRLYTADDVRRLYRILALRQLGMPLGEIARTIDTGVADLASAVRVQLAQVDEQLRAHQLVRQRLRSLLRAIGEAREPSIDELIATMEAMMAASFFTQDQLAQARRRHEEPGFADRLADWLRRCRELDAELTTHVEAGTDPADPAVQELARRFSDLMLVEVSEGDPTALSAVYAKIDGKGAEAATRGALTSDVWAYLKQAFAVGFASPQS
ncbi:MerR family transcriptional regulator [Micromonospora sp. CPCC 205371]|nr:MerR family transcriptional regulator [Micromonospora sp. CPCC 205371]